MHKSNRNQKLTFLCLMIFFTTNSFSEEDHDHIEGHDESNDTITISTSELEELGITLGTAGNDSLHQTLGLSGEISLAPDHLTHIVPRVSGVTRKVHKSLGDSVKKGDLLAVLSSRELAEIKAEIDAAKSRYQLAKLTFSRERKLRSEGITSEDEFLIARQMRDATLIDFKLAKQKLQAIGVTDKAPGFETCAEECDLTLYEIRSPANGVIIEKHIVDGELMNEDTPAFVIADLSIVWVNLTVYQKDLSKINTGQKVTLSTGFGVDDVEGVIDYISPIVSEETRSATARVVIENQDGHWKPGLFVSAEVILSTLNAEIVIPKTALETFESRTVVFVKNDTGFIIMPIEIGRSNQSHVEILDGLDAGDQYASRQAFVLKAELQKEAFGDGHNH